MSYFLNPILTGGGVNLTPPCTKSATASRPLLIATRLFMTFFFQVLRIFCLPSLRKSDHRSRGHATFCTRTSAQNLPKIRILHMFVYKTHGILLILLKCSKTVVLHSHLFWHICTISYIFKCNQDQPHCKKKNHKNNEIHKK